MDQLRRKIFTWHVHGSYLYYLSQGDFDLYIPVNDNKTPGYYGRGQTFPFGPNVIEVPAAEVRNLDLDCILFQSEKNYLLDQYEILGPDQRALPSLYLEHNTPLEHPTDSLHIMNDPNTVLVHVTQFNKLMWHNQVPHVRVIEHGIDDKPACWTGEFARGLVVVNHLKERGRIAGWDIYREISRRIPMDLVGMGTAAYGGLGEVLHPDLQAFASKYRFFFNPMRHTSFGLAVCEAMMIGMPIVALATTEYAAVLKNRHTGYLTCNVDQLIAGMQALLDDPDLAAHYGQNARAVALSRFNIHRFIKEWKELFGLAAIIKNKTYGTNSIYQ